MRSRRGAVFTAALLLAASLPAPAPAATVQRAQESSMPQQWSAPSTWGGRVPAEGDLVTIPYGAHVVLDRSTPPLSGLQIDGTLSFARKNLQLAASWIVVHGTLRIGSERRPFTHDAVVTLTGARSGADVMGMGTKVLGVMGGRLELHGEPRHGWTRLDATVEPGGTTIELARPMPWRVGDRIVLASSDYWRQHDEERTITAVDGRTLTVDAPLEYRHWGELQRYAGGVVDERAEVGLLTRNVVVRGDPGSESAGFGGHLMAMQGARVRIEGVELDRMGQRTTLRRYPVHFHMGGDGSGSYLKRSSIHHSFNRCVVVHGTDRLLIQGNVCFEHAGHGFFLEDGAETGNVFVQNLGLGTAKVENGLLPSDERPATFWITNPDNVLKGNAAAGSDGTGFWYALPEHPTGDSATDDIWPRQTPLGEFRGNVAHSNGVRGLNVDDGPDASGKTTSSYYSARTRPGDKTSDTVVSTFEDVTAYMNRDRGVWVRGQNIIVRGAVLADNKTGATFAAVESFLEDSLVVGETANPGMTESWEKTGPGGRALPAHWKPDSVIGGFELYDGRVGVRRTAFAAFRPNDARPAGAITHQAPNPFPLHPRSFVEGVTFDDSNRVYLTSPVRGTDGDWSKTFFDNDGSVTGNAGSAVVVDNPFLLSPECRREPAWNAFVCPSDFVSLIVGSGAASPLRPLRMTRSDGVIQELVGSRPTSTEATTTLLPNRSYEVAFAGGTPPAVKLVLYRGRGRSLQLALPVRSPVAVTRWGASLPAASSLDDLASSSGSAYFYDAAAGSVHVKLVAVTDWEEVSVTQS
jgi:cell migration-inducing and hyaluronan-binding protein